jgi:hypothetical protein
VDRGREQFAEIARALVARAQAAGQMRPDADATDVAFLQLMVGEVVDVTRGIDAGVWRRYLASALDGLRATATTPLPVPPLSLGQVGAAMGNWQPHR